MGLGLGLGLGLRSGFGLERLQPAGGKVRVRVTERVKVIEVRRRPGVESMTSAPGKTKLSTPTELPDWSKYTILPGISTSGGSVPAFDNAMVPEMGVR